MRMLLVAAAAAFATPAVAECDASLASVQTLPVVQYDPFASGVATAEIAVDLDRLDGSPNCRLALSVAGLSIGSARQATLGGSQIAYRLFLDGIELPNDSDGFIEIPARQLEADSLSIRIEVASGQIGMAGLYTDPITLRLVDLDAGGIQRGPERQASVDVAMESRAQINLAGSDIGSGAFGFARLDFGALRTGAQRQARLQLRSTAPVTIRMSSENGGALTRLNGHGESLAYRMTFDGAPIVLGSGESRLSRDASPTVAGSSFALDFVIEGNPDIVPAGDYRDVIVIDVDPG